MAIIPTNNISKIYKNEYLVWRDDKNFQEAKRQEYLRQNPDFISDYDLQRAKILLYAVDMMDRSVSVNSDHINTIVEGTASVGLGYSAISGATTGLLLQKTKFVQKYIDKIAQKIKKMHKNLKKSAFFSQKICIFKKIVIILRPNFKKTNTNSLFLTWKSFINGSKSTQKPLQRSRF